MRLPGIVGDEGELLALGAKHFESEKWKQMGLKSR